MISCPDCGNGVLPDQPPFKSAGELNEENAFLRGALKQITMVCDDNKSVNGDGAKMALNFVRDLAARWL